jgi:gluconokinase
MSKAYILAIDIGTTSTKAIAFDDLGNMLQKQQMGYPTFSPSANFQEQSPVLIYKAVMSAAAAIIQLMNCPPQGIIFSAAMHSVIAVDEQGNPLTHSIIWADGRSQDYANQLRTTDLGKKIYHETGTPIHAMSPLCKIAWLRDHQPDIFHAAFKFISIKEWIMYQWFGQYWVDYSIASATGLFDIRQLIWHQDALAYCGIDATKLSQLVPTDFICSPMRVEVAYELGISSDLPVVIGASDGCLANLGEQVLDSSKMVISIGTSAALRITHHLPIEDPTLTLFNYLLDKDHYIVGGPSNSGGAIHEWFEETIGLNADTHEQAQALLPSVENPIFLPYLLGERAPLWNAQAKGAFLGLTKKHQKAHLYRAMLEGIIFNLYAISDSLKAHLPTNFIIYANGGFTQNELAMQLLADIFGTTVHLQDHEEGTSRGAALLGWKALSTISDWQNIKAPNSRQIIHPDLSHQHTYQHIFNIWKRVGELL